MSSRSFADGYHQLLRHVVKHYFTKVFNSKSAVCFVLIYLADNVRWPGFLYHSVTTLVYCHVAYGFVCLLSMKTFISDLQAKVL